MRPQVPLCVMDSAMDVPSAALARLLSLSQRRRTDQSDFPKKNLGDSTAFRPGGRFAHDNPKVNAETHSRTPLDP